MKNSELLQNGATPTEIQAFLAEGETAPVTMRMPSNLRGAAKEAAALNGMNFNSFVKQCLIEKLSRQG